MIIDIFKTSVFKKELNINNDVLNNYANSIEKNSKGCVKSNRGGFQSEDLSDDCLTELKKEIVKYANDFSKAIYETKVNFSNIWCNINYYKDYNLLHDHNDEMISGVYYTQTPKDCGNIFFFNPAWQINRYPKLNNYSAQSWWLPSKEGTLYLFPSWLLHNVEPNLNKKKKRISFSFNLI